MSQSTPPFKAAELIKGSDSQFEIKLKDELWDPFDLTGVTRAAVRFKKQGTGNLEIDNTLIPALFASSTLTVIADAGLSGSTINVDGTILTEGSEWTLTVGDNSATALSIQGAIDAVANVSATVSGGVVTTTADTAGVSGNSIVFTTSDAVNLLVNVTTGALEGGVNAFQKVAEQSPLVLGKLLITLTNEDTNQLRVAKRQTIEIIIDKGAHPGGERTKAIIENAITVINSPI